MLKKPMLDLDLSFLVVFFMVWILMLILNKIFFKPVGKIISEREELIARDSQALEDLNARIVTDTERIEQSLRDTRLEAKQIQEKLISQGEAIREDMVERAREESRKMIRKNMADLDLEIQKAESQLKTQINDFSTKMKEIFLCPQK